MTGILAEHVLTHYSAQLSSHVTLWSRAQLLPDLDVCIGACGDLHRPAQSLNDGDVVCHFQVVLLYQLKALLQQLRLDDLQVSMQQGVHIAGSRSGQTTCTILEQLAKGISQFNGLVFQRCTSVS